MQNETPAPDAGQPSTSNQNEITPTQNVPNPKPVVGPEHRSRFKLFLLAALPVILIVLTALGYMYWHDKHKPATTVTNHLATTIENPANSKLVQGQQLDTSKNYGNKYADGVLPVGDGKYSTSAAKQGYIYACSQYAQNLASSNGGAMTRGPWFSSDGTTYNIDKKVHVSGSVMWSGTFTNTVSGSTRTIVSNDLPVSDPTGTFPIVSTDPAYVYDHNPNSIKSQSFTYALAADPTYNSTPNCESGQVGVMTTGVALFNALDAGGRDAGAWEVQDNCSGHPQSDGIYHYHTLSSCIKDTSVHDVIGYALDGFPITGPKVADGSILTTSDLDECHGIVSQITLDGKSVTMYHYVMTEDFPYSVSCFRGTAITPPGQSAQAQGQQSGQVKNQTAPPARP